MQTTKQQAVKLLNSLIKALNKYPDFYFLMSPAVWRREDIIYSYIDNTTGISATDEAKILKMSENERFAYYLTNLN